MNDNYVFHTDANELYIKHLYVVEGYSTFHIKVKSGEFCGGYNFCISNEVLKEKIEELLIMNNELKGNCKINDYDSDSFILIEMESSGNLQVNGQIGGSHEYDFMKFKYSADQTILNNLIKHFNSII